MTVSVLIPAYNAAEHLAQTVPQVLGLSGVDEWIWVDDGSTDATFGELRRLTGAHPHVSLLRHPSNRGRASARNSAIEAARGEIFAFLDADASPRAGYIAAHLAALERAGAVASVGRPIPSDPVLGDPYTTYLTTFARGPGERRGPTAWNHFLSGIACLRADAVNRVGGFNPAIPYGEDAELACRLAGVYPTGLSTAPGAVADLYGTDTLQGALAKTRQFGAALRQIRSAYPDALETLRLTPLTSWKARLAFETDVLTPLVCAILGRGPQSLTRVGVRYLLGRALYQGFTDG